MASSPPPPASPETTPDTAVDRSTEIDADLEEVWEVLTDPDALGDWLGAEVDLDVRPGGVGRVVDPDGTRRQVLVTEVDEPHRVAWHWWEDGGPLTSVEITLSPTPGGTRVDVVEIFARQPATRTPRGLRGSASASITSATTLVGRDAASFALAPMRWATRLTLLSAAPSALATHP